MDRTYLVECISMTEVLKRASWLELFYDLAYVALVAQLTYLVAQYHSTFEEVLIGLLISYMIFVGWWGTTANRNLQDSEDTTDKLFIQLQMLIALLMSISMSAVYEGDPTRFFLLFAVIRLVQVLMMLRMYAMFPDDAPPTKNIAQGITVAVVLWCICAYLESPLLLIVAYAALLIDIMTPLTTGEGNSLRLLNVTHMQERLGLFLILVIGESMLVVAITSTAAQVAAIEPYIVLSGMIMMVSLWWMYFDYLERCGATQRPHFFSYLHAHAALFIGVVLMAAGFRNVLLVADVSSSEILFIGGGFVLCLFALMVVRLSLLGWRPHFFGEVVVAALGVLLLIVATMSGVLQLFVSILILTTMVVFYSVLDSYLLTRHRSNLAIAQKGQK